MCQLVAKSLDLLRSPAKPSTGPGCFYSLLIHLRQTQRPEERRGAQAGIDLQQGTRSLKPGHQENLQGTQEVLRGKVGEFPVDFPAGFSMTENKDRKSRLGGVEEKPEGCVFVCLSLPGWLAGCVNV